MSSCKNVARHGRSGRRAGARSAVRAGAKRLAADTPDGASTPDSSPAASCAQRASDACEPFSGNGFAEQAGPCQAHGHASAPTRPRRPVWQPRVEDEAAEHMGDGAWYALLVKKSSRPAGAETSRRREGAAGTWRQGDRVERSSGHAAQAAPPLDQPAEGGNDRPAALTHEAAADGGKACAFAWRPAARDEVRAWQRRSRLPSPPPADAAPAPAALEQRLNRAIAESGFCSRRKADELIFSGRVSVNGTVETHAGRRVAPEDCIAVDGTPLPDSQRKLYLMLHKPVQVVSTAADPEGRPTVLSLLPGEYADTRLFPVGRLDYFSEGLILLTNDGQLSQRLMHPRHHLPKCYEVIVRHVVTQKALQTMRSGMRLAEGEVLRPVEVTARSMASGCTLLRMVLRQGVNRQIRRMCRDLNLTILRLRRVAIGPLQLGDLPPGRCRPLRKEELAALRQAAGLR